MEYNNVLKGALMALFLLGVVHVAEMHNKRYNYSLMKAIYLGEI